MQEYKTGTMFIVLGVVFILLSLFFGTGFVISSVTSNNAQKALTKEMNERTDLECLKGKVSEVTEDGKTQIKYMVGYDEYDFYVDHKMSAYGVGTEVDVYFKADAPANAIAPELEIAALQYVAKIFGIIGAVVFSVFLIPAAVFFVVAIKYRKKAKKIMAERQYY